ncbi:MULTISPECIES: hypothetical protein [unclassified Desulfovibrio]|uniref:hypothetical protein n=1 Tax=unclassified Desulfovibrio TaxID=2593640 RepID=UPI001639BEC6|nr:MULTISPECIES: hypothetical protein [unclassified Desulfovibrio]
MLRALLHKEKIKLRHFWWLPVFLCAAALLDYWLTFRGVLAMHGAVDTWNGLIVKKTIYFTSLKWAFLASAAWMAAVQMLPECHDRRLRLLFHLPVNTLWALGITISTGITFMLVLMSGTAAIFCGINHFFGLPQEISGPMLATVMPWALAALSTWCAVAASIADPAYLRKTAYVLVGIGYISLLTGGRGYAPLQDSLCLYALACLPWLFAPCVAALRVKEGN